MFSSAEPLMMRTSWLATVIYILHHSIFRSTCGCWRPQQLNSTETKFKLLVWLHYQIYIFFSYFFHPKCFQWTVGEARRDTMLPSILVCGSLHTWVGNVFFFSFFFFACMESRRERAFCFDAIITVQSMAFKRCAARFCALYQTNAAAMST